PKAGSRSPLPTSSASPSSSSAWGRAWTTCGPSTRPTSRARSWPAERVAHDRRRSYRSDMAFVAYTIYPGVTHEQADQLLVKLGLAEQPAPGQIVSVSSEHAGVMESFELWMTREAAERYLDDRLRPAMLDAGIHTHPEMRLVPLHNAFAPDIDTLARIGAYSLPAGISPIR